nr:36.4 kDa proline-rich protein-like [Ipomoea trifida]
MKSFFFPLLFAVVLFISSVTTANACRHCKQHSTTKHKHKKPKLSDPSVPIVKPCPPPPPPPSCPVDTQKLGACVDLLGGLVHIGLGDPLVNQCCPLLKGLVEVEAAACLCTTLKIKALNLNIYVPIALQLLVTCGKPPPPGYTCSI